MNTEKLDNILEVAPDATKPSSEKTAIEMASEIISADIIDTTLLIPSGPASNTVIISALPAEIIEPPKLDPHNEDLKTDVDYAREQMKDLIDQGRLAVQGAMELAEAGDSPRAYEVVATMITAVINANKELVHLHKTKKDATRESVVSGRTSGDITNDNAVFVGKTDQLLREIKAARKAAAEVATAEKCSSDAQPLAPETNNGEKS